MEPSNAEVGLQKSRSVEPEPVKKTISVGSSSADRELALEITHRLSEIKGIIGECWTEEFPLGLLTFEALERTLRMCAAAVFIIVTADDHGRPNDNVMIEVGLVAGRMGRTRVTLCTNGNVHLPSDLAAVTRIENTQSSPDVEKLTTAGTTVGTRTVSQLAIERLREWATALPAMLQGAPCTHVLHGYSGRWRVVLNFEKWRHKTVGDDIAALNADVMLHIPAGGQGRSGILIGKLTLKWQQSGDKQAYTGLFHVCSSISNVTCPPDGSMTLRTQTLMRQAIVQTGDPLTGECLPEELAAPWIFRWVLKPAKSDPGLMDVTFNTDLPSGWTEGKGSAYRESASSF
jgi:Predicted nucleotide-binding protein containing TIR-like domain